MENGRQLRIFLNTLPKSGSVYIWECLATGLDLKKVRITGGVFPNKLIARDLIETPEGNGYITQDHVPANRFNLLVLNRYFDRMILHVRDPRQALLSWIHHLDKLYQTDPYELMYLDLPKDYVGLSLNSKIDWQLENHLHVLIDWIQGWLEAAGSNEFTTSILFTSYERMREDPERFFRELLEFYEVEEVRKNLVLPTQKGALHFREGKVDEWKKVYSPQQRKVARAMIPKGMLERFQWK